MKIKSLALLALMLIGTQAVSKGITFQNLSLKEALSKAQTENKYVFIDVYATWCGPCKYLASNIFTDDALGTYMNKHYVSIQLDGEKGDGLSLMYEHQLEAFPTMLFMSPDGKLHKKIVGVVEADEIQKKANGVRFPESTEVYKLAKRFDSGERDREFLQSYLLELVNEQKDATEVAALYLKSYPNLDLENINEFIVFLIAVEDRSHPLITEFYSKADVLTQQHGELVGTKMEMLLFKLVEDAVSANDKTLISKEIPTIYKAYNKVFGENSLPQSELEGILVNYYTEATSN